MNRNSDYTVKFSVATEQTSEIQTVLKKVYQALKEKGYNPVDQIVGYLVSGDPAYITSHNDARGLIKRIDRNDLLEEIVGAYLRNIRFDDAK